MLTDADHVCQVPIQVDTTINTIGYANTVLTQLDTFSSTSLQPLSTFNKAVMSIANVRPSN